MVHYCAVVKPDSLVGVCILQSVVCPGDKFCTYAFAWFPLPLYSECVFSKS